MVKQGFKSKVDGHFATRLTENVWPFVSVSKGDSKREKVDKGFGKNILCGVLSICL